MHAHYPKGHIAVQRHVGGLHGGREHRACTEEDRVSAGSDLSRLSKLEVNGIVTVNLGLACAAQSEVSRATKPRQSSCRPGRLNWITRSCL